MVKDAVRYGRGGGGHTSVCPGRDVGDFGGSGFWRVASRRADLADILTLRTAMTANLGTDVVVRSRTLCPGIYARG